MNAGLASPNHASKARRQITIAHAHTGSQSYVYLVVRRQTVAGSVQFPVSDLNNVLDLSIPQDQSGGAKAVKRSMEEIRAYAASHLSMADDSKVWAINFRDVRFKEMKKGSYVFLDYTVPRLTLTRPTRLTISFDGIIESVPERDGLLIVLISRGWGNLLKFTEQRRSVYATETSHIVDIDQSTFGESLITSINEGMLRLIRLPGRVIKRLGRQMRR